MKEIWKEVPDFPGYEVSNLGRVRSFKRATMRVLSPSDDGYYWGVGLMRDGKAHRHRVGRLVLLAFVGPPPDGMEMCHNDGGSYNDRLDNLRYDTRSANMRDASRHGRPPGARHKLNQEEVRTIRIRFASGKHSRQALAREYRVSASTISDVLTGSRAYKGGMGPIQELCRRLSDQQVVAIRQQRISGRSLADIAEEYGVSESMVSLIVRGRRRRKAGGPRVQSWEIRYRPEDF